MQTNEEILQNYQPMAMSFLWTFLLFCVIHGLSFFMLFRKAGITPWKALIPFYSLYLRFRMAWKTGWLYVCAAALVLFFSFLDSKSALGEIIALSSFFLCIGIEFSLQYHIGRAFGWHPFPCVLLALINPIILPVLAYFSKSYHPPFEKGSAR